MRSAPLQIPDIAEPISVEFGQLFAKPKVFHGSTELALRRARFEVPHSDGRPRTGRLIYNVLMQPFPTVEIDGTRHRTGPAIGWGLRLLCWLPLLLIALGGVIGGALGGIAAVLNIRTLSTDLPRPAQVALILGCSLTGFVVLTVIATVVELAFR